MKRKRLFLEHKKYGKHWKETSKEEFRKVFNNQYLLWRIDMSMAAMVEEKFIQEFEEKTANRLIKNLIKILIKAPSTDEALKRFISREGSNADIKEFQKRLKQDKEIWNKYQHRFPHILINHNEKQEEALQEVLKIVGI